MNEASFFKTHLQTTLREFLALPRDRAAALLHERIPDLLYLLRQGKGPAEAMEPRRTVRAGRSLEESLVRALDPRGAELQSLRDRIVTDAFLRSELDRDQNVYLGPFFTRVLTGAIPDVAFQPVSHREIEVVLEWARRHRIGIATRGAGTTAMGGAVPNHGGLVLEMSRFESIQIDKADRVAVIGAGARLKSIHALLAAEGLALATYPSNLGGTLAGWFSAGGLGLNSFKHGPVQDQTRALSIVLPRGEHVRFHHDGRLDALSPEHKRFTKAEAERWLEEQGYGGLRFENLAQSEGQFGVITTLTMQVQDLPRFVPFYLEVDSDKSAIELAHFIAIESKKGRFEPANLKFLSAAHVAGVRRVRGQADGGAKPAVYVDFEAADAAQRFEVRLAAAPSSPHRDDAEARRWFDDRFRPQQTKRLGPGFLAAEILLPEAQLAPFQASAAAMARRIGVHLETEAYFFGDGRVLALPGYLTRGPRSGFLWELVFAPVLLDLAMRRFDGKPYVLGRWQSPYFGRKHAGATGALLRAHKKRTDERGILNPGVFFRPAFRIAGASGVFRATFPPAVRWLRSLYSSPLTGWMFRAAIRAHHADGPVRVSPRWQASVQSADADAQRMAADLERWTLADLKQAARGCVNCGECNSVCPIFDDARIRLPQMLTHIGEGLQAGAALGATERLLLDLCMRCGNCQEVCQADIPHLPLYAAMEHHAGSMDAARRDQHVAILQHLRHSEGYTRRFLGVRGGGYLQRTPASLPGEIRFVLFRAENDAGPVDTCIHCGACVPVCPTSANLEFQDTGDVRRISTDLTRCIGCGTCVEVCPANQKNGGHTLRVVEAPNRDFFDAAAAFELQVGGGAP
jgi:FAD/FMN-containing dehydrogenase/ferredoxin